MYWPSFLFPLLVEERFLGLESNDSILLLEEHLISYHNVDVNKSKVGLEQLGYRKELSVKNISLYTPKHVEIIQCNVIPFPLHTQKLIRSEHAYSLFLFPIEKVGH